MPPKRKLVELDDAGSDSNNTTTASIATKTTTTTTTTTSSSSSTSNDTKIIIPVSSDLKQIYWVYQESIFEWKDFKLELIDSIEKGYQFHVSGNGKATAAMSLGNGDTIINFNDMTTTSSKDANIKKPIKRVLRQAIWSWEKARGEFYAFKPDISNKVESSFLKGLSKASINSERYINFSSFEQARFDDDTKTRRVKRNHIDITESNNQSWYYLSSDNDPKTWELLTQSLDIGKSWNFFLEKGERTTFKLSDDETICFLTMTLTKKGTATPIKRDVGPITAIKRSYSQLTEDERKVMINQMLSGKGGSSDSGNNNDSNKKIKVDKPISTTSSGNGILLPGELEVLSKDKPMKYILRPSRHINDCAAVDAHFRQAESQFYRLINAGSTLKVTKVEYICNPKLTKAFNSKMEEFKKKNYPDPLPLFAFHGTSSKNIIPICKNNFVVPGGKSGVKHANDTGWYGKGIYFSEFTDYSIGYITDCTKILLCKVLLGKSYKCTGLIHGKPCTPGYTSHLSPDEKELVIFEPDMILPTYIVHYQNTTAYASLTATGLSATPVSANNHLSDYNQACSMATSSVLDGLTISLLGNLATVQYNIQSLITKHGGSFISHATNVSGCTTLVTTRNDYDNKGAKVLSAEANCVPIVSEAWLYKTIITNKVRKTPAYSFNVKAVTSSTTSTSKDTTVKPIPLEQLEYDDVDDDSSDDEEDEKKKKPPCKYGDKCYRKSGDHFKEFSHSFLID